MVGGTVPDNIRGFNETAIPWGWGTCVLALVQ